jgi:glutamate--cysteine ligase
MTEQHDLHLTTIRTGPLDFIEQVILQHIEQIESWFRTQWLKTPPPITSSVDLRHAGFKLAPVDTNLFPAGFNNLNPAFRPLCIQAIRDFLSPDIKRILLIPEEHTRNRFYLQSLVVLINILRQAGFEVRIGQFNLGDTDVELVTDAGEKICFEPIYRIENKIYVKNFEPCLVMLNNDLSAGVPEMLQGLQQQMQPAWQLGWSSRFKSTHFDFFDEVTKEFVHDFVDSTALDAWLINPYKTVIDGIDFMQKTGIEDLAYAVDQLLEKIQLQYNKYNVNEKPFVVIKSDNGTYGMSVMMVNSGSELFQLSRKQRKNMSATKGSRVVSRVLIQEGIYSADVMSSGAVAEPVVYMIGPFVVGGFYRVHTQRGKNENLNAPGMHFEPLTFTKAPQNLPNRFYVYGVIARLAALAAARESAAIGV